MRRSRNAFWQSEQRRSAASGDSATRALLAAGLGMRTGGGSSEPDCCLSGREVSLSDRRKTISGGSVATRAVPTYHEEQCRLFEEYGVVPAYSWRN